MTSPDPADANRKTVKAYDVYAERYAENTRAGTTALSVVMLSLAKRSLMAWLVVACAAA